MHRRTLVAALSIAAALTILPAFSIAQTDCEKGAGPLRKEQPQGISTADIIRRFTAKESLFSAARVKYTYTQDISVQTLNSERSGPPSVDGEFRLVLKVSYDPQGKRIENQVFAPQSTLRQVSMTPEDMEDVRNFFAFPLTTEQLPQYNLTYLGLQHVDQLDTYAFDVAPKSIEPNKRYFQGRVWVDKDDTVIVKTCGKSVPEPVPPKKKKKKNAPPEQNVQPKFVTYRELIDGQFWFPTYMRSDDVLHFNLGQDVQLREVIKFQDYKRTDIAPTAKPDSKAAH